MTLTLTSDIDAETRYLHVTGTVPDSIQGGYRFRLGDEALELQGFAMPQHTITVDRNRWYVRRAQDGSAAASHTTGTEIKGANDAFISATSGTTPPNPFAGGPGGSQTLAQTLALGNDANGLRITNAADGVDPSDMATVGQLGGGGGGALVRVANGLWRDYDLGDVASASAVTFDSSIHEWSALTRYAVESVPDVSNGLGSVVTIVGDTPQRNAFGICKGISGVSEPTWPTTPFDSVIDGEVIWFAFPFLGSWQADTEYALGDYIVANGDLWQQSEQPGPGTSGSDEPDWSSVVAYLDTIADGTCTWNRGSPAAPWQSAHEYAMVGTVNGPNDYVTPGVLPTTPAGYCFLAGGGAAPAFVGTTAVSGATEPAWNDVGYTFDGSVLWNATSGADNGLVLTGIVAPSGVSSLRVVAANGGASQVTLIDTTQVEGDYGTGVASDPANVFDIGGNDIVLDPFVSVDISYAPDAWHLVTPYAP